MREASEIYRQYFADQFDLYGADLKSLGCNPKSQKQRFEVLSEIGDLNDKDILDVGCGFGDFRSFLNKQKIQIGSYAGIDLNYESIKIARERHPTDLFFLGDILELEKGPLIDYSFASGLFCLATPGWYDHFLEVCQKMFDISEIGVGFNLLSIHGECKNKNAFYAAPSDILSFAEVITHKVVLRHDYRDNDFTIYMYR